jgi:UDP:flavonoid glycosyltransferase YjiC (YdhE family)
VKDELVPPVFSGYPTDDTSEWPAFWAEYDRVLGTQIFGFDAWLREHGGPGLPSGRDYMYESPFLNMYLFPEATDYPRTTPLPPTWHRLDSSVRTDEPFDLEAALPGAAPVVYLSLGSLGSADVELMQRLIDVLGTTDYRVIVSKGPQHELLTLADNMFGEEFLPQPSILPQVDVVITHGGNNTVTECFHFGKPMIVLPLFWDQYDNAQRVDELNYGTRLDTYRFEDEQLTGAIASLLADEGLKPRHLAVSQQLQASPGNVRAADLIERLAATGEPVTS